MDETLDLIRIGLTILCIGGLWQAIWLPILAMRGYNISSIARAIAQTSRRHYGATQIYSRRPLVIKQAPQDIKHLRSIATSLERMVERQAPLIQEGCDMQAQEPIAEVVWYHGDPAFEWVLRFDDPERKTTIYLHNSGQMAAVPQGG